MGKGLARTTSWKKTAFVFVAVLIFLLPVKIALANSAAPPSVVWFTFDFKTASTPRLLGVQLIACLTANCEQPVLLQQYGTCDHTGCITSAPQLTGWSNDFGCATNICRSAAYPSHGGTDFKLVAQFSDRVRASEVVEKLPSNYGESSAWQVIVLDSGLSVEAGTLPAVSNPGRVYPANPLLLFGISILVEILVAGLCFWWKVEPRLFESSMWIVLLVNLLSLPVVWFFFPSLGRFQSQANQSRGLFVLFAAFIYAALLSGIYRSGNKTRNWLIGLTLLSLPVTIFFSMVAFSFFRGYYARYVTVQGFPANLTVFLSEVFAVVFEALLITILTKRSLSLRLIWMTSLVMNAASFVTGLLLVGVAASSPPLARLTPEPPTAPPPTPGLSTAVPTATNVLEPNGWISHGPEGGIILALAIDPQAPATLYAGASFGSVFKSTDGGGSWAMVEAGVNVHALAVDPLTPSTLFAGTWSGIFKSTDAGLTWQAANTGLTDTIVYALAIDPRTPTTLYAGTMSGVFKSTDTGATWQAASTGLDNASVGGLAIDPWTPTTLYAVGSKTGLFKSTDGGGSWAALKTDGNVSALAINPRNPFNLYAGSLGGVLISMDGGGSWVKSISGLPTTDGVISLAIDPGTPDTLFAGTYRGEVFTSTNGGGVWSKVSTGLTAAYVFALVIDPTSPDTLYAGTSVGGVFKTTDAGRNWSATNTGLTATYVLSLAIDPLITTTLYAGTLGGVFKSTDAGGSWEAANTGLIDAVDFAHVYALAVDPLAPATLYAGTPGLLFKSTDGGGNWTGVKLDLDSNHEVYALAIDPKNTTTLYVGTLDGLYKSNDAGLTWNEIYPDLRVRLLAIDPLTSATLYAGTGGEVFKTTDGGAAWNRLDTAPGATVLAIDPAMPSTLYAGTGSGMFKSMDAGLTWEAANTGLTDPVVLALAIDPATPATIYAGTDGGVFKSTDGGGNWEALNTGLAVTRVCALAIDPLAPANLYVGTNSGGVFVIHQVK